MRDGELKVQIQAENRVNSLINDYFPGILANAQGLVGRQVFKADGSLRKDALAILDMPKLDHPDMIYLNRSTYSLGFTFKTCCTAPSDQAHMSDHCAYSETTVYIGNVSGNLLEAVNEHEPRKTDYDFETVRELQKKAREARDAYNAARSACNPFGES
jgi:hypothetical protein